MSRTANVLKILDCHICTLKTEYNLKLLKDRDIQKRGATMKIVVIKVKKQCSRNASKHIERTKT